MQIQTLLLSTTLALSQTALALQYHVANCGQAAEQDAASTRAACLGVIGSFCDRTGLNRCVVNENYIEDFKGECAENGQEEVYVMPATYGLATARRIAGCL